jgi:hypothetical protein
MFRSILWADTFKAQTIPASARQFRSNHTIKARIKNPRNLSTTTGDRDGGWDADLSRRWRLRGRRPRVAYLPDLG